MPDGGLQAHWNQNAGALLKGLGTYGSGGCYELYSNFPFKFRQLPPASSQWVPYIGMRLTTATSSAGEMILAVPDAVTVTLTL